MVPEDRKTEGLFLHLSGKANASLPILDRLAKFGWIDGRAEAAAADAIFAQLNVPPRALYRPASSFSGGNQQKIVLAKSLLSESEVLLLFDPTRGVDIGTKHEIYLLVRDLAGRGQDDPAVLDRGIGDRQPLRSGARAVSRSPCRRVDA